MVYNSRNVRKVMYFIQGSNGIDDEGERGMGHFYI